MFFTSRFRRQEQERTGIQPVVRPYPTLPTASGQVYVQPMVVLDPKEAEEERKRQMRHAVGITALTALTCLLSRRRR